MKTKKKFSVSTHILVDFDSKDVSESLKRKLWENRLADYQDRVLKEDIYSEVQCLKERAAEEGIGFTKAESLELDGIARIMLIKQAAYFRIIF